GRPSHGSLVPRSRRLPLGTLRPGRQIAISRRIATAGSVSSQVMPAPTFVGTGSGGHPPLQLGIARGSRYTLAPEGFCPGPSSGFPKFTNEVQHLPLSQE